MALLAVQEMSRSGIVPTYNAASASDTFPNDGRTYLHVKNVAAGGDCVVAVVSQVSPVPVGTAKSNVSVTVADGAEKIIGPFPSSAFTDPATGNATVTFSEITNVTVAVIRMPAS